MLTKRHQARNERILQELVKTVPGNSVCADCQARNPGWASWSLGIFICMRCAAHHRKLGTHITKVKSLSMDSWSHDQVEIMKRIGNLASNQIYNPENTNPPVHYDPDTTDSAMERYIRQKYKEGKARASQTPNTEELSISDLPPPLPPKNGITFSIRSTSKSPLAPKIRRDIAQTVDHERSGGNLRETSHPLSTCGVVEGHNRYCPRNGSESSLENCNGNIETLTKNKSGRLLNGEIRSHSYSDIQSDLAGSRVGPSPDSIFLKTSTNPFDLEPRVTKAQPQSSQSTGALPIAMNNNLVTQPTVTSSHVSMLYQPSFCLDKSLQAMSLDASQQLFPNRTGPGFPRVQNPQLELNQHPLMPQMLTVPQEYHTQLIPNNYTQLLANTSNSNPFVQQSQPQLSLIENNNKIYLKNDSTIQDPHPSTAHYSSANQGCVAFPDNLRLNPYESSKLSINGINPFVSSHHSQLHEPSKNINTFIQNPQEQFAHQGGNLFIPQQNSRFDKKSILELYNYPQLAPKLPVPEKKVPQDIIIPQQSLSQTSEKTSIANNNNNPFICDASGDDIDGGPVKTPTISRHVTRESQSFEIGGWMNGRHSPDACFKSEPNYPFVTPFSSFQLSCNRIFSTDLKLILTNRF